VLEGVGLLVAVSAGVGLGLIKGKRVTGLKYPREINIMASEIMPAAASSVERVLITPIDRIE
jgi:hypothetical protein